MHCSCNMEAGNGPPFIYTRFLLLLSLAVSARETHVEGNRYSLFLVKHCIIPPKLLRAAAARVCLRETRAGSPCWGDMEPWDPEHGCSECRALLGRCPGSPPSCSSEHLVQLC